MQKKRLDSLLVERKLAEDLKHALALILSGRVFVDGKRAFFSGERFKPLVSIEVKNPSLYVSRAGVKLDYAIKYFGVDIAGNVCLDIGASTGGFTDCLLKNGAKKVYALDVGQHLLDEKLKNDPRVVSIENLNFKYFSERDLLLFQELPDMVTVDVSFISLKKILKVLYNVFKHDFEVLALIKPQFEVSPDKLIKGVVKDTRFVDEAVSDVVDFSRNIGFGVAGVVPSPIKGAKGNTEYLVYLKNG